MFIFLCWRFHEFFGEIQSEIVGWKAGRSKHREKLSQWQVAECRGGDCAVWIFGLETKPRSPKNLVKLTRFFHGSLKTCLVLIQSRNFQENSSICLEKSAEKSKKQKSFFREIVVVQKALLPWLLQLSRNCCCLVCQKKFANSPMSFWQKMKECYQWILFRVRY